jgi:hypothetical protein
VCRSLPANGPLMARTVLDDPRPARPVEWNDVLEIHIYPVVSAEEGLRLGPRWRADAYRKERREYQRRGPEGHDSVSRCLECLFAQRVSLPLRT